MSGEAERRVAVLDSVYKMFKDFLAVTEERDKAVAERDSALAEIKMLTAARDKKAREIVGGLMGKEHQVLMSQFEQQSSGHFDTEPKRGWKDGIIYQDGDVNEKFLIFREGYVFGKFVSSQD